MKKASCSNGNWIDFEELKDENQYKIFIQKALKYSDSFVMSTYVNHNMRDIKDFQNSRWGYLSNSILDYEYTSISAVTQGADIIMIYFRMDEVTSNYLLNRKNIFDFKECEQHGRYVSNWLWDLALIKEKVIYFVSCTHEEFCQMDEQVYKIFKKLNK